MIAFSSSSFSTDAFSVNAFAFGDITPDSASTGGKGDNASSRRKSIYKPTGLPPRLIDVRAVKDPVVARQLEQSIEIAREIADEVGGDVETLTPIQEQRILLAFDGLADELRNAELISQQAMLILREALRRRDEDDAIIAIILASEM